MTWREIALGSATVGDIIIAIKLEDAAMVVQSIFHDNIPPHVKKKSHLYFLHNNFQNPIVSKWMLSIDELTECFIRIVAVMVDIFRLGPK